MTTFNTTNGVFSPSGTTGQLAINGVNVASGASVTNIIRTDWKGIITLSTSSRTNTLKYSEQIDNAAWVVHRVSKTSNATTAPDGTSTADQLTEDSTAANDHSVTQDYTSTAVAWVLSAYMKAGSRTWGMLSADYGGHSAWFDLTNGVVGHVDSGATSGMVSMGSGWYRCWVSYTLTAATNSTWIQFPSADWTSTWNGNGSGYAYLWGTQIEIGSTPTAYIINGTNAAISVTDYSYTSAGVVTLGETATGTYTWTGSGVTVADGGFQTNAFENTAFDHPASGGAATATPSGVSGTAAVGTATISAQVNIVPTGVAATGSVGTATAQAGCSVVPSGVSGTSSQGSPTVGIGPNVSVLGVSGTGSVGTPTVSAAVNQTVLGVEGTAAFGTVTASGAANVVPSGVSGTASVGTATASGGATADATAFPDGVQASGQVGDAVGPASGLQDNQAMGGFRIFNLRKRKNKPRVPLILDIDSNIPYTDPIPAQPESEPEAAVVMVKPARRVSADRWMTAPLQAVRVALMPRTVAPVQVLAVQAEAERTKRNRNHALRLLLLAS
jgi:hypothetical protein